jgi:ABC-type uncharacterized transport system fused permease/ATPase subunit
MFIMVVIIIIIIIIIIIVIIIIIIIVIISFLCRLIDLEDILGFYDHLNEYYYWKFLPLRDYYYRFVYLTF